jgi:hypothetical protein
MTRSDGELQIKNNKVGDSANCNVQRLGKDGFIKNEGYLNCNLPKLNEVNLIYIFLRLIQTKWFCK